MHIYWSTKSIPELTQLPKGERDRLWAAVRWKHLRHWQWWVTFAPLLVLFALLPQVRDPLTRIIVAVLGGAVTGGFLAHIGVHVKRPYLRALLEDEQLDRPVDT